MHYYPAGAEFIPDIQAVMTTFANKALFTMYPFVNGKSPKLLSYLIEKFQGRSLILDSGVFTLQGQAFERTFTKKDILDYTAKYIKIVKSLKYEGYCIDVDFHRLFVGWEDVLNDVRQRLYDELGDRLIVTWHTVSGIDDWEYITDKYPRVATNVRDLGRLSKMISAKLDTGKISLVDTYKFLSHKSSVPIKEKHVHLLGSTNTDMFALPDNVSIDSTTWSMIVRYGRAFPNTPNTVTWWRRKKVNAPANVVEYVKSRMDEVYKNYLEIPNVSAGKFNKEYTYALACALVSSQYLAESTSIKSAGRTKPLPVFSTEGVN